jgi:hypothetical protein
MITVDVYINATLVSHELSRVRCLKRELRSCNHQVVQTVPVQIDNAQRSSEVLTHLRALQFSYVLQVFVVASREVEYMHL